MLVSLGISEKNILDILGLINVKYLCYGILCFCFILDFLIYE